jgi:NAD(P)H-dependent flavin oxidoreductase YrpB (nitropropane dioxygenase family)
MADGFTPPELVAAVANVGSLGSLAAALLSPAEIRSGVAQIRGLSAQAFNVNLFVLDSPSPDAGEVALSPFDVVVQRGTNHYWLNHGAEPALLRRVLVDAR